MERERGKKHVTPPRDGEGKISGSEGTTKHGWLEVDQGSVLSFPIPAKYHLERPVRDEAFTKRVSWREMRNLEGKSKKEVELKKEIKKKERV